MQHLIEVGVFPDNCQRHYFEVMVGKQDKQHDDLNNILHNYTGE